MWRAFRTGGVCDLRPRRGGGAGPESPGSPGSGDEPVEGGPRWPAARTVRAQAVAELLLNPPPPERGRVGALRLAGARVSGSLMLAGGTVVPYVQFDDCRFDEELVMPECSAGSMRFVRCLIPRLEAARLQVAGDLHLPQCVIPGGIRLSDANIGSDLLINQLTVRDERARRAVAADGLTVGQDVEAELMDVTGELSLRSARIGGRLSLRGAALRNPRGAFALNAARISVEHTLYLSAAVRPADRAGAGGRGATAGAAARSRDFVCDGALRLDDGRFGNAIVVHRARLTPHDQQQVSLRRVQAQELCFTPQQPPTGRVVLTGARLGGLVDNPRSWPPGRLSLTGLTYDTISARADFPLAERLAWLRAATPEYAPEAYERLAAALRTGGEDADAREVLFAKQRRRRESLPLAGRMWGWLQDVTVGYGYRPGRAAVWMAVLWALGAVYFTLHGTPHPADDGYRPHWSPALYALDLLLPVIDLGQDNAWRMAGAAQWVTSAMTLLGWVLATTAAAGASRLLRRGS
ncbi:oxidoreductase [Actinacidiphila yanglinensis]|nr:oxidoreductase [Actinacidiphila yanglinensis]